MLPTQRNESKVCDRPVAGCLYCVHRVVHLRGRSVAGVGWLALERSQGGEHVQTLIYLRGIPYLVVRNSRTPSSWWPWMLTWDGQRGGRTRVKHITAAGKTTVRERSFSTIQVLTILFSTDAMV